MVLIFSLSLFNTVVFINNLLYSNSPVQLRELGLCHNNGVEDFLLRRNAIRTYKVLVDLMPMRVTIQNPKSPDSSNLPMSLVTKAVFCGFCGRVKPRTIRTKVSEGPSCYSRHWRIPVPERDGNSL